VEKGVLFYCPGILKCVAKLYPSDVSERTQRFQNFHYVVILLKILAVEHLDFQTRHLKKCTAKKCDLGPARHLVVSG
jgi:hypothetical protein